MSSGIYLSICPVFWCESFSRRCSAVSSLKQLIHSGITKAEGTDVFSLFSAPEENCKSQLSRLFWNFILVCERVLPCSSQRLHSQADLCVFSFFLKATHRLTPLDLCKWNKIKCVPCIEEWHKQIYSPTKGFSLWVHILAYICIFISVPVRNACHL